MKKLYFTLLAIIGITAVSSAQYVDNALLFSQQNYGSTARSKAMGNAFGALGGDFGSLSINPAGIAIYQRGEVSTTMSLVNGNATETTYQGNLNKENNNNFNFKNFGYVSAIPGVVNSSGLVSINFGIGYNRLANFNQNSFVSTESSSYSRMDAFAQQTNGIKYNNLVTVDGYDPYQSGIIPWESKLAWENYLIDVTNSATTGDKYATFLLDNEKVKQRQSSSREGFINEYIASFGANFNHKLYLGATIGMQDLFYDEAKVYSEIGIDEVGTNLKSWGRFDYTNNTRSTGVGYNLKLGAIFRPIPVLRIGLALHTPTYSHIKETYSSSMSSNLVGISTQSDGAHKESTPIGNFEYNFQTPLRAIASVAYQFGKKAMFSMDYEFVDYASSKFSHGYADNFSVENGDIKAVYKSVSNVRLGAEYRLTDAFSLRGGLEFLGNPYKSSAYGVSQPNMDYKFTTYNGGFGYRSGKYSVDVTYSLGDKTNYMYLYHIDGINVDPVKYHNINSEVLFTFAIRM
ncbi:MAG: outer membrane protein transport protein [Bacteroidia bacterium]|nr:outer membrane protein transport protein [Bacteroidia bacterium]